MGGIGSGRRYQNGKSTTSDYRCLDARRLQRDGCLGSGLTYNWSWHSNGETIGSMQIHAHSDRIILDYRHQRQGEEWEVQRYPVMLDWTVCHYGGQRGWFRCPASGCGRRVALLYLGRSGIFACRQCYQLVYSCQHETHDDRATRRADNIRDRLGWNRGILNPNGSKPKGMHWKTYQRLTARHNAYVDIAFRGIAKRFGFLDKILGK